MLLRPYQSRLVERAEKALKTHGNTLAIAATGAGKTLMLSDLARRLGGKQLVIQHRQELVTQNRAKFLRMNPKAKTGLFTAETKTWRGDTTFAMVQTLANSLDSMPKIDVLIADEAHHCAAPTWRSIIEAARNANPGILIAGFTATPKRSDRKGLREIFSNVCDTVSIKELVNKGFLVPPRAFVVDVGGTQEQLMQIKKTSDWFDQSDVERVLNTAPVNAEIIRNWRHHAHDRRTVVFCTTVQHAQDVAGAFRAAGVSAECVHGEMSTYQRKDILQRFDRGKVQVVTNVMVLTEGWDCQPVSCVILLRKCSSKSPMLQMIGRGLRTVNQEEYPGERKLDCIVLDFGTSILTHGEDAFTTDRDVPEDGLITCPKEGADSAYINPDINGSFGCGAQVPVGTEECPFCEFVFQGKPKESAQEEGEQEEELRPEHVTLTEVDILNASPFRYVDLFQSGRAMIATGFEAWAGVFSADGEVWSALGKVKDERRIHRLAETGRVQAMAAADDFLREHETESAATKTKRWLDQPATPKQLELLNRFGYQAQADLLGQSEWTKYAACAHAEFQFNRRLIEAALGVR